MIESLIRAPRSRLRIRNNTAPRLDSAQQTEEDIARIDRRMANPTGQEMRAAITIVAERMGYGKLYDRLVQLNAFVSRRRPATPALLADRLYTLSGGLRRQVAATVAFHTVWSECIGRSIGEEHDKTLEAIAERINATLTPDEQGIQPDKVAELETALGDYEQVLVGIIGPEAARLDMILKAVNPVADTLRARPPATAAPAAQTESS